MTCVILILKERRESHWLAYARGQRAQNGSETRKLDPAVNVYKLQAYYEVFLAASVVHQTVLFCPSFLLIGSISSVSYEFYVLYH